jgi:kynureninase
MSENTNLSMDRETCVSRDAADPLNGFLHKFDLPEGVIYLDGNSLGAKPRAINHRMQTLLNEEWGKDLIKSWNTHDWYNAPRRIGDKIGQLVGAASGQIVAADSTSINLFKALSAALAMRPDRKVIVSEKGNFPTDLYVAQGLMAQLGGGYELRLVDHDAVYDAITDDVAVAMITQVDYRSGSKHDMTALTAHAHDVGALMLWDLAHSAGAFPVELDAAGADFAVGCGYKYINGGPGAPAFIYVASRHQQAFSQPLSGWMGHAAPFAFGTDYQPAEGISRYLCGTPSILAMTSLEVSLDLILSADMEALLAKSSALTGLFIDLVEARCQAFGFELITPRDPAKRGSQVSFAHPEGYAIMQALIAHGVIGDFRAPDVVRFGFAPLYIGFTDVYDAVEILHDIMAKRLWDKEEFKTRNAVT